MIVMIGQLAEHLGRFAGLFADVHHLAKHRGKIVARVGQSLADRVARLHGIVHDQ